MQSSFISVLLTGRLYWLALLHIRQKNTFVYDMFCKKLGKGKKHFFGKLFVGVNAKNRQLTVTQILE